MRLSSDQPVLVERPEYENHDFGPPPHAGVVNGGNVSIGLPDECVSFT